MDGIRANSHRVLQAGPKGRTRQPLVAIEGEYFQARKLEKMRCIEQSNLLLICNPSLLALRDIDRYAEVMFDRKCDFAERPDDKQYTIIDAEVRPGPGLLDFERKDLPRADMVQLMLSPYNPGAISPSLRLVAIPAYKSIRSLSLGIAATDFYKIFESYFDKALLRSLADGHIGFQWAESNTFYLGTHSFALLLYAPTPETSEPHRAIYIPSSMVENGFDFLQAFHEHPIDDLLQDMRDEIGIKSASEEIFVDKANFLRLADHQIRLN
ncbi:hypothetical protein DL763_008443 [Monosporascus cannonballus]|nr:hypothetical protein DL763_008443 [Monosporascus cannonballus]